MNVLLIGGSGEISSACAQAAQQAGHRVTVYNRGRRAPADDAQVEHIPGDVSDVARYAELADRYWDVVCQFLAFNPQDIERDVQLFAGRCGQYIFISSASAYQKPCQHHVVTEQTPLANPFMAYSRNKAACELALGQAPASLPVTIVRPSHTYRERMPSTLIDGDHLVWRLLAGKPLLVHGDGESLWTITRAEDFARAFVQLFANPRSLGEVFHITDSEPHTWNVIFAHIAQLLGRSPTLCHVASERLIRYQPDWRGPLLGDKSNSMVFDNTKIRSVTQNWHCELSLIQGLERALGCVQQRLAGQYQPPAIADSLIDKIVHEQNG